MEWDWKRVHYFLPIGWLSGMRIMTARSGFGGHIGVAQGVGGKRLGRGLWTLSNYIFGHWSFHLGSVGHVEVKGFGLVDVGYEGLRWVLRAWYTNISTLFVLKHGLRVKRM